MNDKEKLEAISDYLTSTLADFDTRMNKMPDKTTYLDNYQLPRFLEKKLKEMKKILEK